MPTYEYRCISCSEITEAYRTFEDYKKTPKCSCGGETEKIISAPAMVAPDLKPYPIPGTAQWITSRSEKREYLKKNGLIEIGNEGRPPTRE